MNYRLLALDLDGTLLDSRMLIRKETLAALELVRARGVQVMIVTGRHHVAAYPYWHQLGLDSPVICCNGAYVYDYRTRSILTGSPLSRRQATMLLELVREYRIFAMVYDDRSMAYETMNVRLANLLAWSETLHPELRPAIERVDSFERMVQEARAIWKFTTASDDSAALESFARDVEQRLGLECDWSGHQLLDITHTGNSKGHRLAQWIAEQGVAREEVLAIGDHHNDLTMLRLAGMGVAMGNGVAEIRACADWVTGSNDGDGIVDALQRFVLTP